MTFDCTGGHAATEFLQTTSEGVPGTALDGRGYVRVDSRLQALEGGDVLWVSAWHRAR